MAINTDYYVYNDYSSLFGGNASANGSSQTNGLSKLYKLTDYSNKVGYSNNSNKYVTADVQDYLSDIKSESEKLKNAMQSLLGKNKAKTSVFDEKSVVSSNTESVTVQTTGNYKNNFSDTSITVNQVATAQKNEGAALSSTGKALQSGWNQFEIEVNGKKHQISFKVEATDNNESIQKKIANAVNEKNIGVKASVTTDGVQKTSKLTLEAENTGDDPKNAFTVRDIQNSGGAVGAFGIGSVTQVAGNAVYKIGDGNLVVSQSNKIDLGNGVTATLKKASDDPVKISTDTDPKNAINKVREMVNGFNGLLATAEDNKSDRGGNRLMNQLKGLSSAYSAALGRIGVNVTSEGYLSIDSDKMEKAAESGELEKFFGQGGESNSVNTSYGFANRLSRVADSVSQSPTDYVSKDKIYSSQTAGNSESFSYLQTYRYNSIINSGLLFDMISF